MVQGIAVSVLHPVPEIINSDKMSEQSQRYIMNFLPDILPFWSDILNFWSD